MRADRLLSMLMLLQNRGCMTARELADELEVSERTIYRDIEALSFSGVPVFAEHGPNGGFSLLDSYRTNLTGLTAAELQTLFAFSIPAPFSELGLKQDFQSALLKLSSALPGNKRDTDRIRERIQMDWESWSGLRQPTPFLGIVHQAIFANRQLIIRYRLYFGTEVERKVHPLGLVAKTGEWYLVCSQNEYFKVHKVSGLSYAEMTDETGFRPDPFDLEQFWKAYCLRLRENSFSYPVTIRIRRDLVKELERITGKKVELDQNSLNPAVCAQYVEINLTFSSLEDARSQMLSLGGAIEVITPQALRLSMIDFAEQIRKIYTA